MFTYSFINVGSGGTLRANMSTTVNNNPSGDLYKILDIPSSASFDEQAGKTTVATFSLMYQLSHGQLISQIELLSEQEPNVKE